MTCGLFTAKGGEKGHKETKQANVNHSESRFSCKQDDAVCPVGLERLCVLRALSAKSDA